jgi:hypothetical protein
MNLEYINLADYPLDRPESSAYQSLVIKVREELKETGLINLENFLTPKGIDVFRDEVYAREPEAYNSVHGAQGYFNDFPTAIPDGVVGSDTFCLGHHKLANTAMDELYRWEPTSKLIADLTGNSEVFLHEDPTNALVVQMYKPGCWTGWHFDRAVFTTIINLGEPASGGVFECAPDIRTEDDPHYAAVGEVLHNQSKQVQRHDMQTGSLTLMLGRYSLHRVTKIAPGTDRISLVLKYETQPGVFISAVDRKWIYGPSAPGPEDSTLVATN